MQKAPYPRTAPRTSAGARPAAVEKRGPAPRAERLEAAFARYHHPALLPTDPLEFLHRYTDPHDQEAVGLVAALLAYGNVTQIRRSVTDALSRMHAAAGGSDAFVRGLAHAPGRAAATRAFEGFVHRFHGGADLIRLFSRASESRERWGSVGAEFVSGLDPRDETVGPALARMLDAWTQRDPAPASVAYRHLISSPAQGSCCKRWCMFLRWMGRKDALDPGLWTKDGGLSAGFPPGRFLRPDQLVIPLDTHVGRICKKLGMTRRKTLNWKAAEEITRRFRSIDAADPIRFDFSLCRAGMLKEAA